MFERRTDLTRLVAVAEAGRIGIAADHANVTQPTLTRDIARLEARFGGRLFERLPDGVRPTPLGRTAIEHARRILRATGDAGRDIDAARSGHGGVFRITATPCDSVPDCRVKRSLNPRVTNWWPNCTALSGPWC